LIKGGRGDRHPPYQGGTKGGSTPPLSRGAGGIDTPLIKGGRGDRHPPYQGGTKAGSTPPLSRGD
ncbi:MAG: hypothetical protein EWV44_18505, partial [Microcystis flos-aquae Mf_QC_C_20070823_S20T]